MPKLPRFLNKFKPAEWVYMRSVFYVRLPQWFGSNTKSLKVADWSHPSLQSIFALWLQARSTVIKHQWIQTNPKRHVCFLCAGMYYGDEGNPSNVVEEDRTYITVSIQATMMWLHREEMSSWGTQTQKFLQASCSMPGTHVPAFPVRHDSLLMTKVTQKNPSENRASCQKRLQSCNSHFSNVLLLMNHKNNTVKCADFCSFPLFCWN